MPAFANPFQGNVDRKISKEELIQAIRLDIAGELEAIYLYDAHVQATDDEMAQRVISDIRDEEKAHVGELMTLLRHLDPQEAELLLAHVVSCLDFRTSVLHRPVAQPFARTAEQPCKAARLEDQEADDQTAEDHQFEVRHGVRPDGSTEQRGQIGDRDRQQHDERGSEEGTGDTAQSADGIYQLFIPIDKYLLLGAGERIDRAGMAVEAADHVACRDIP